MAIDYDALQTKLNKRMKKKTNNRKNWYPIPITLTSNKSGFYKSKDLRILRGEVLPINSRATRDPKKINKLDITKGE